MYARLLTESGLTDDDRVSCDADFDEPNTGSRKRNMLVFKQEYGNIPQAVNRRKRKGWKDMLFSRRHGPQHRYTVTYPLQHGFTVSMIALRLEHISKDLQMEISRQGEDYVQYAISSHSDIGEALRSVFTRDDARCTIGVPLTSSARYRTVAYMQERAFYYRDCGHALQAALLSLRSEEAISIQVSFRALGRARHFSGQDHILMSVVLHFSGSAGRLANLIPETADRKKWRVKSPGKGRMHWNVRPANMIDDVIPPFLLQMRESGGHVASRHYLHPTGSEVTLERMVVKDIGKTMQIGSVTLDKNMIVFGGTGTGKTSSLAILAKTLIEEKRSVLTIDPNGDLGPKILGLLSPDCYGNVLYIDSKRTPAGINPISVLQGDGLGDSWIDLVADAIAFSIRMTYGDKFYGPRLGYLLRLIIKGLAEIDGANLYDAYKVLTNLNAFGQFRETVQDQRIREALEAEEDSFFSDWGMPIKNKLGLVLFNDTASRMLCKRKGNLDIGRILDESKSVLIDTDIASVGKEGPSLIGSFALAVFWLKSMSLRKKLTIIIDEFQNYPVELVNDIATQGRKYGVNLIIATQSPSVLDREHMNSFGSNFPVKLFFRLGQEDALLASKMTSDIDYNELTELPDLSCIFSSTEGSSLLSIGKVLPDHEAANAAIEYTSGHISLEDDVMPSVFFQDDTGLFKMLQAVRTSETMDKKSISQLSETGFFDLAEFSQEDAGMMVKTGRKMDLIESRKLRLTRNGRAELLRLQGGFLAGDQEHRMMALRTKDLLETLGGYVAYIPVQGDHASLPDVMAMPVRGKKGHRIFAEIEYSTSYDAKGIEMKLDRAWSQDALPVLVFYDRIRAERCFENYGDRAVILLLNEVDACILDREGVKKLGQQEMLDFALNSLCVDNENKGHGTLESSN